MGPGRAAAEGMVMGGGTKERRGSLEEYDSVAATCPLAIQCQRNL